MSEFSFGTTDYVLFGLTLLASAAIGVFFSVKGMFNKNDSPKELLFGGGHMPVIPTSLSLLTSFLSGVTLLGIPAEVYTRGALFWLSRAIGTTIGAIVAMLFVLPILWDLKPVSVYEYLEHRFCSRLLRWCGAVMYLMFMAVYMAVVLYAPSVALSGITKVDAWVFFISVGVLCNLYTSFGGLKAVVWTDTLQCAFMFGGLLAMFAKGIVDNGGLVETFTVAQQYGRFEGFKNFSPNPFQYMTFWTSVFGGPGVWFSLLTFNQISVQRYLSLATLRDAKKVLALNIPGYLLFCFLADMLGIVMFTYYYKRKCDPIAGGIVENKDQLVINYSLDVLGVFPGLPGIFLACLFSGTLSTISSGINSMVAVTWEDFLSRRYGYISQKCQSNIMKVIGLCYGFLAIGLSFGAGPLGGILKTCLSVMGAIGGPLVGLFVLGMFFPTANRYGAFIGLIVSVGLTFWIATGNSIHKPYQYYSLPVSISNCSDKASARSFVNHLTSDPRNTLTGINYVYGLSEVFYATFGILILLIVGVVTSCFCSDSKVNKVTQRSLTVQGYYGRRRSVKPQQQNEPIVNVINQNINYIDDRNVNLNSSFKESQF